MKHNRFAVVRDWEDTVSAEEECLRRIQLAAFDLGISCDIVDTSYRLITDRSVVVSSKSHDFVLHLHYCSGKAENVFSFVPLWNPIDFFHKWGYRTSADTFLTNDDFLRSTSEEAELHLKRLTKDSTYHLPPYFSLFPAPNQTYRKEDPLKIAKRRLMYCGINWERLDSKKGRFSKLLKKLDDDDLVGIYGPEIFHGIRPWAGYKNYKGSIPFDGVSMIDTISKSGIGLVISSDSHFKDEVVSNRLFETIAAGAVIISDCNPGVQKLLGESCLYIDTSDLDIAYRQIKDHLSWIDKNPELASQMILKNQKLFDLKFSANSALSLIYSGLDRRKEEIYRFRQPIHPFKLTCFYLLDSHALLSLEEQVSIISRSVLANSNPQIKNYFLCDNSLPKTNFLKLAEFGVIIQDDFFYKHENLYGRKIGSILSTYTDQFFSIILPGEELFNDHFVSIIKAIQLKGLKAGTSDFIIKRNQHGTISFIGRRWDKYCEECWSSGNFIFDISVLQKEGNSLYFDPLSYAISNFIASCEPSIATSNGYSCKIHQIHSKTTREIEAISDCRNLIRTSLVQFAKAGHDQIRTSLVRRFYDKNYKLIVKLKSYPFFWEKLKKLLKPFM